MRPDRGHQDHHATTDPPWLRGARGAEERWVAFCGPGGPAVLWSRAREVLGQVEGLERDLLAHQTLQLHRVETVAGALDRLQVAIAEPIILRHPLNDLVALRAARRCVADALALTIDLLERL